MKLDDLLKHDTIKSIVEGDQMVVPMNHSQDSGAAYDDDERLKRYQRALDRYKDEKNSPKIRMMQKRVDDLHRVIKYRSRAIPMVNPYLS